MSAQDTLSPQKWWLDLFGVVGVGCLSNSTIIFNTGINYNHVVSRRKNIYIQIGGDASLTPPSLLGSEYSLTSANLCVGKIFLKHRSFRVSGFIGPSYMEYQHQSYEDPYKQTIIMTPGVSANLSFIIKVFQHYKNKEPVFASAIGIALSTNINTNMSVVALRISTLIIQK